jgi:macrodomain Ter protein organizer (MatP/YcbG family)
MKYKKINEQIVRRMSFADLMIVKGKPCLRMRQADEVDTWMGGLMLPGRKHGFFRTNMFVRYRPSPHRFNMHVLTDRKKSVTHSYKAWGRYAMRNDRMGMGMNVEP